MTRMREPEGHILDEPLPHSSESEKVILGAIILDNGMILRAIEEGLETTDFYVQAHAHIYEAMLALAAEGREINPVLLGEQLRREGRLALVGGLAYVSELTYGLPHFTNLKHYSALVRDASMLRQGLKTLNMSHARIMAQDAPAKEILAEVEGLVLETIGTLLREKGRRSQEFVDTGDDEGHFHGTLVGYHQGQTDAIETPIPWLNDKLEGGGFQKQGLYVVAAPPKVGKTSLILWFADHMAQTAPGGLISMEMARHSIIKRLFARYAGIPFYMMRKGFRGIEYDVALASIKPFFERLRKRLYIVDSISTTPQFRRASRKLVNGPAEAQWIEVDYLQLASATANPDPHQRAAEVGQVSRDLKGLAQELDVPLIAISSVNQEGEKEGRRPELTDLAWTGNLRYDAEAIFFLHNQHYKRGMTKEEWAVFNAMKVWDISFILAAQRNGPTDETTLKFLREHMKFVTVEEFEQLQRARKAPANPGDDIPF